MNSLFKRKMNKKGVMTLQDLPNVGMTLVLAVLILAAGAIALQAFQDSTTADSFAYNISSDGLTSLDNTTGQLGTIGTIVGVVILIGIIVGVFVLRGRS